MNKINIKYNLLDRQNKKSLVIISVTWEGNRIQKSAGLSVITNLFDTKKGRLKRSATNAFEVNQYLDNLAQELKNYYTVVKANNDTVTKEMLKIKLKRILNPDYNSDNNSSNSFFKCYDEFINERTKSSKFGRRTIQGYFTTIKHLKNFINHTGYNLTFSTINHEFADKFFSYLILTAGLVNNSADKIIKTLKIFLNDSVDKGIITDLNYKKNFGDIKKAFKISNDTQAVALNEEEILWLEKVKLPSKRLRQIRDLFLIQIYTCTRYSDLINLKPENIKIDDGIIKIYQIKTAEPTIIPISKKLRSVLVKYDGLKLPHYSNQKFNNYIKEVCKQAGIITKVEITKFYGKKRVNETYEKWQLVSSHTARRTNITVSLKKNVLPEMVMQISGHKSRAAFQKYVKIAQSEALDAMRKVWD